MSFKRVETKKKKAAVYASLHWNVEMNLFAGYIVWCFSIFNDKRTVRMQ